MSRLDGQTPGGAIWGPMGPQGESIDSTDTLNLAGILNTLDGVVDTPARLLVMTSNHPEKLDPALIRHLALGLFQAWEVIEGWRKSMQIQQ